MIDKRKLGEWLEQTIDSHGIYSSKQIKEELATMGYNGPYPHQTTVGKLRNHLGEFKGPEQVKGDYQEKTMNGWELAAVIAEALLGYQPDAPYHGRGSRFDACVRALKQ